MNHAVLIYKDFSVGGLMQIVLNLSLGGKKACFSIAFCDAWIIHLCVQGELKGISKVPKFASALWLIT